MKEYLGDGVYAEIRPYHLVLTTENGIDTTNEIFLEPEVLDALQRFLERAKKRNHADPSHPH